MWWNTLCIQQMRVTFALQSLYFLLEILPLHSPTDQKMLSEFGTNPLFSMQAMRTPMGKSQVTREMLTLQR